MSRRTFHLGLGAGVLAGAAGLVALRPRFRAEAQPSPQTCRGAVPTTDSGTWQAIARQPAAPVTFPLRPVVGQRFLVDAAGRPFLLVGDTAWSLIAQLSREDCELYLDDRQARGFNTVLVNLIEHKFADQAPRNMYGDRPFEPDGDFSAPNDRYFDHAAWVLSSAARRGILVLLAPAYLGTGGGDEGWYQKMLACGPDKLRDYGRYVGRRFRDFDNIIWVDGGDYDPPDARLSQAVSDGIRDIIPHSTHTAHNAPDTDPVDFWKERGIPVSIDALYTYAPITVAAEPLIAKHDMPYLLIESRYENEHDGTALRTRIQAWQAMLSGASGQVFGNHPIWHYNAPAAHPQPMPWKQALDSAGARSISSMRDFLLALPWSRLEPDRQNQLLVGGVLTGHFRATAARSHDKTLAVVYLPSPREVVLDLTQMATSHVGVRWFDPANGRFFGAEPQSLAASKQQTLRAPACSADGDWVLLLTA